MIENNLVQKMIDYKLIEHERCEDAPFVGALIAACDCRFDCHNCFNQHIKMLPTISKCCDDIIAEIKSNVFNQGIIFAGLEWTLQPDECLYLARRAKQERLQTMLYTGNNFNNIIVKAMVLSDLFDYIKCGRYEERLKTVNHIEYGVALASSNQHIYKRGVDY